MQKVKNILNATGLSYSSLLAQINFNLYSVNNQNFPQSEQYIDRESSQEFIDKNPQLLQNLNDDEKQIRSDQQEDILVKDEIPMDLDISEYTVCNHNQQDDEYQMEWAIKQERYLKSLVRDITRLDERRNFQRNLELYEASHYKDQQFITTIKKQIHLKFQSLQKKQKMESQMMSIYHSKSQNAVHKLEQYLKNYSKLKYCQAHIIQQFQIKLLILKEQSGQYDSKKLIPIITERMRMSDNNCYQKRISQIYKIRSK